jgi:CheY-like chemotaxis protein
MTKILIAEDNATNRELFRELLEARGYTVDEACSSRGAPDDGTDATRHTAA